MSAESAPQTKYGSPEDVPGAAKTWTKTFMELGASSLQNFDVLKQHKVHLCGFAHYASDPQRQVELHHICASINDEVIQCAVYESERPGARLIGIEYVVSKRIFETLDGEEQKLWHSHVFDVKSGSFIAPGIPLAVEHRLMEELISTYGKTYILWQVDRGDKLPLGQPQLMQVATRDGEWNPDLFAYRDKKQGYDHKPKKENVKDIPDPGVTGNVDWYHNHPNEYKNN